jgi:ATP-dependent Clp protease, protease subunit
VPLALVDLNQERLNSVKMRITYLVLVSFVVTAMQAYASVETPKVPIAKKQIVSLDLQKMQTFEKGSEDAAIKQKEKETQELELENALNRARLERELADLRANISRLMGEREIMALEWDIEQEKKSKAHKETISELKQQKERLETEVSIAQYKLDQEEQQFRAVAMTLDYQAKLLRAEVDQMKAKKDRYEAELQRANYADTAPIYLKEPLQQGGTLIISDRRIELNGCISPWKANYIIDRIQYFNNKNVNNPIFIVIQSSPGGSVMAGSQILKAMENSQAPVYVVVQGFAASMAACIATLADRSFAYPNAIILHHQPWTFAAGNVRELKEGQEFLQEWWSRLGGKVAKKMGVSLEKLDELLYKKSARGDWEEFADRAEKLKWVDHTINGIKDSGIRELPSAENYTLENYYKKYLGNTHETAKTIENGVIYLPPLDAKDFYYLYNPDNRYQMHPSSR